VKQRRWAALGLTAGVVVYVAPFALTSRVPYGQDLFLEYAPQAWAFRRDVLDRREWPLWNETHYAGTPRSGDFQEGYFSPIGVLHLLFPPHAAHEICVVAYIAFAAVGMYRLTRSYRLARSACVTAALAYALSFPMTARIASGHITVLCVFSLAPLVLYRLRRTMRNPTAARSVGLAWCGALPILGGQPQFLAMLGILATGLAATELRGAVARRLAVFAGTAVLIALMTAVRWLPALEVVAYDASRPAGAEPAFGKGVSIAHAFVPENIVGFLLPRLFSGGPYAALQQRDFWSEKAVYLGVLPLVAAAFSAGFVRRTGVRFFLIAGLAGLAFAMARDLPFHLVATHVLPVFGRFRLPGRAVWIVVLAICVLSAFGLDAWFRNGMGRKRFAAVAAGISIVSLALLSAVFGLIRESALLLGLLTISGAILAGAMRWPRIAATFAIVFVVGDLSGHSRSVAKTVTPEYYARKPWYLPHLGEARGDFRVLDQTRFDLAPTAYDVRLLRGYGYPDLRHTQALVHAARGKGSLDPTLLDELNVGWLIAEGAPPEPGLVECARRDGAVLYRRPGARGRFFGGASSSEARRHCGGWEVRVEARESDAVVFGESWMPGWSATVNGRPAKIELHRGALMRVDVPQGTSVVRFEYRPRAFFAGLWMTLIASTATVVFVVVHRLRASRADRIEGESRRSDG